jgi:hypothetical protein
MLYYNEKGGSMHKKLAQIEKKIALLKNSLQLIGEMRPGSLTKQYQNRKEKKGGYYQISYTYQMKSRTEYVRPEFVDDLRRQVETFKRFKSLIQQWTDWAIEHAKLKMELAKRSEDELS